MSATAQEPEVTGAAVVDTPDAQAWQAEREAAYQRMLDMGASERGARAVYEAAGVYQPGRKFADLEELQAVYRPDPKNDRAKQLQTQLKDRATKVRVDLSFITGIGQREQFGLDERRTKEYFALPVDDQMRYKHAIATRKHLETALAAARNVRESGSLAEIDPYSELCLRRFDGLSKRSRRVQEAGGSAKIASVRRGFERRCQEALATQTVDDLRKRVREDFGTELVPAPWGSYRPTYNTGMGGAPGYPQQRLPWGPNEQARQLYLTDVWDEQAKCLYHYQRDAVVKRCINAVVDYVIGRGVQVICNDEALQDVVDQELQRLKFRMLSRHWLTGAMVFGEGFYRRVPLGNGQIDVARLAPPTIWEIHTDPESGKPISYVQRYTTRNQLFAFKGNVYIEREIPAADIVHYKRNAKNDEVRGFGDPYAALIWHQKLISFWDAQMEKDYAAAAFQFLFKVKGDKNAIQEFVTTSLPQGRPSPGGSIVVNDLVETAEVLKADGKAASGEGSGNDGILSLIAGNYGLTPQHLGVHSSTTRAGASVAFGPSEANFETNQDEFGDGGLEPMVQWIVDEARANGGVPSTDDPKLFLSLAGVKDFSFRLKFAAIVKQDSNERIKNLVVGRAQRFISLKTASEEYYSEMDIGDDVDFDDEQKQIDAEAALGIGLPPMPPGEDTTDANKGQGQDLLPPAGNPKGTPKDNVGANDPNAPSGTTGKGRKKIMAAKESAALREAADLLSQNGAIVILS